MIAVLFNGADVRLGEVRMPEDCMLIGFGGELFVRMDDAAVLDDRPGELGVVFVAAERYVLEGLDKYNPRRGPHAEPQRSEGSAAAAVQGRPAAPAKVVEKAR